MYFRLNPEALLTTGDEGGIICDVFTNKIYHLNRDETNLIVLAENNNLINLNEKFYYELENECLGTFYENIPYIHKIRKGSFFQKNIDFSFKSFFLELTNICNNDCNCCAFKGSEYRSLGCLGCNSFDETGEYLDSKEFFEIVDCISNLGCDELYLTGGDLSLNLDFSKNIISYVKDKFQNVFIIQSYNNNYQNFLDLIGENVYMILQINLDTFNLNLLHNNNLIYLVLVSENEIDSFYSKSKNISNINFIPDFLTKDKKINLNLNNNYHFEFNSFFHNLEFHPCLGKSLFISSKGNIYPCPMFRSKKWGNVKDKNLLDVLNNIKKDIFNFWKNNLDNITTCKNCEFRYLCSDCRVLEEAVSGEVNNKTLCDFK